MSKKISINPEYFKMSMKNGKKKKKKPTTFIILLLVKINSLFFHNHRNSFLIPKNDS